MTMVAHGILALREHLANKEIKEIKKKLTAELSEEERLALDAKLDKAYKKASQRHNKMRDLKRVEKK